MSGDILLAALGVAASGAALSGATASVGVAALQAANTDISNVAEIVRIRMTGSSRKDDGVRAFVRSCLS
jgi:hypothetical protein